MDSIRLKVQPLAFHSSITNNTALNASGKVILPQSVLSHILDISHNEITSPLIFTIVKDGIEIITVGVEEFSGAENYIYLPHYIIEQHWLPYESEVTIKFEKVKKGTKIELEPHKTSFLDSKLKEKKFLESYISKYYPVLCKGSIILIKDGGDEFYINIKDTVPHDIILTVDTDIEVEFAQPLDYVKPPTPPPPNIVESMPMPKGHFIPFAGKGYRLGHKS